MAADTAAARREARRRRILENSENRLHKITGRYESGSEINTQHSVATESENALDCKVQKGLINGVIRPENIECKSQDCFESAGSKYADEILRRVQNQNSPFIRFDEQLGGESEADAQITRNESERTQFLVCDLHFIYLAVVVRVLYEFRMSNLFCDLMILPYLFLLLPREILLLRDGNSNAEKVIGGALILIGLPHYLVATCIKCVMIASHIAGTFAMYLFAFTVTDCVIATANASNIV